ncbi:hypothetical protein AAW02_03045 [Aeromonas dhakensis]|nr:hypothetical protein AAW03_06985 [Aeromonas dhakensis]PHS90873.1 hypothetical protein AAW02_03045 [Aeromonas dhakensis]
MTKSKEPTPLQEAASPSSQGRPEAELRMAPIFPPPHPFETYLFERLTTYAQGYLPLPWPHDRILMSEEVQAELDRRQAEGLAEMDRELAAREIARLAARERKRISSTRYVMKCWVTAAWTRLHQWIRAHHG